MARNPGEGNFEKPVTTANGIGMLLLLLGLVAVEIVGFPALRGAFAVPAIAIGIAILFIAGGFFMLQPNEASVLTLFGAYLGTERRPGLRWTLPWNGRARVSVRARNYTIDTLKVNDKRGNPVEIGAAVVWRVHDTAQAVFEIDDYTRFVSIQAEAAIRHLATLYAYDSGEDLESDETTLRAGLDTVADALKAELNQRFASAGVEVLDAKLTHLAYAPEIAQVMLRRQQATAIVSARHQIVAGAVGMVEAALKGLSERNLVVLDDERKAAMVSNLLVVLCSDNDAQPVINTGTLYT
jgi:regulator of protease activity HflC (stomatin/prohibitin superfamily)